MARVGDELLHENTVSAERRCRFRFGPREAFRHLIGGVRDAHALAATAGTRLDHHRIADLIGDLHGMGRIFDHTEITRDGRDMGGIGEFLGFDLVTHGLNGLRVRTDENDTCLLECFRECGTLGEKAITGVNRFRAGLFAGVNDLVDHQIGLRRRCSADEHGLIRHFNMQRVLVGFGIDGNRLDPHAACGLDDTASDFATVCDQDFLEHAAPAFLHNRWRF